MKTKPHSPVGTWQWAERTGGALDPRARRELWSLALRGELQRLAQRFSAQLDGRHLDLARIPSPDSVLATAARELCERVSSPGLHRHCLRTYAWGALLGQRMQQSFDAELLYVASLLHDLGLTPAAPPSHDAPCFAVSGARVARTFLLDHGVSAERALRAAECITLHMNPYVPGEHTPEAQLMAAGAALDAIGARKHELARGLRESVLQRHPYNGFQCELLASTRAVIRAWPNTRASFLEDTFGFLRRIAKARL